MRPVNPRNSRPTRGNWRRTANAGRALIAMRPRTAARASAWKLGTGGALSGTRNGSVHISATAYRPSCTIRARVNPVVAEPAVKATVCVGSRLSEDAELGGQAYADVKGLGGSAAARLEDGWSRSAQSLK